MLHILSRQEGATPCRFLAPALCVALAGLTAQGAQPSPDLISANAVKSDLAQLFEAIDTTHPAPYRIHARQTWEARRAAAIERAPMSLSSFYAEVLGLIALARDGHMDAYLPAAARSTLPVKMVSFPEGVFVVAAAPRYRALVGARVVALGPLAVDEVVDRLRVLVPSDNDEGTLELLEDYLRSPALLTAVGVPLAEQGVLIVARAAGSQIRETVAPVGGELPAGPPRRPLPAGWIDARDGIDASPPIWQRHLDRPFWHEPLPRLDALYVQINAVREDEPGQFERFVGGLPTPTESGLSRLVIDLRTNRGGDATLLNPFIHAVLRGWSYLEPGKVFLLTSSRTFSAAVHLAADLERQTHAVVVGESTAAPPNHYGDVRATTLEHSGIEVEISRLYWQKSDPRDRRAAMDPDVTAPLTWAAFLSGRDPALEAIATLQPGDPRLARPRRPAFNWLRSSQRTAGVTGSN